MLPLQSLVDRFIACTLPKAEWTHEAHLRVGAWHVHHHGLEEAMVLLRERIPRYNEAVGGVNTDTDGYHDTLTWFYLVMIDDLLATAGKDRPPEELTALAVRELGDRELPFSYYSREHLMSVAARRGIVEPDLAPLPGAVAP